MAERKRVKAKLHSIVSFHLLLLLSFQYPWLALTAGTKITFLPGFSGPLPFYLETGYIGVGESEEDQLFYYFVESETNPEQDPLVMWLTGGPGCSVWSAFAYELGPLYYDQLEYNGSLPTLVLNSNSWTKISNIIFVDAPPGTGFSFSKTPNSQTGDFKASSELYEFLRKWLNDHPQFLSNPLYIGGDSYSGMIIPIVVQKILSGNEAGQKPVLNLKGYFAGNPVTDHKIDTNSQIPYYRDMALISEEIYELAKTKCNGDYTNPGVGECADALEEVHKCIKDLNTGQILEPSCSFASTKPDETVGYRRRSLEDDAREFLSHHPLQDFWCRSYGYLLSYFWANDEIVRSALNIQKGSVKVWKRCNYGLNYINQVQSVIQYHLNVTTKGYRALIYSGDHDGNITHVGTQTWIKSLNFSIVDQWRPWYVDGQVAGYTRSFANNLTFATVKGAGHTAPEYKPRESFVMFKRWIFHQPL